MNGFGYNQYTHVRSRSFNNFEHNEISNSIKFIYARFNIWAFLIAKVNSNITFLMWRNITLVHHYTLVTYNWIGVLYLDIWTFDIIPGHITIWWVYIVRAPFVQIFSTVRFPHCGDICVLPVWLSKSFFFFYIYFDLGFWFHFFIKI